MSETKKCNQCGEVFPNRRKYADARWEAAKYCSSVCAGLSKITHGCAFIRTPEYAAWLGMAQRCENANDKSYKNYGARGISVCERWRNNFEAFLADMGGRPSPKHSLDRRDVNQGYDMLNCRWATAKEQQQNRRNNRYVELNGERVCLAEAARRVGMPKNTLLNRMNRSGMTFLEAITVPIYGSASRAKGMKAISRS